MRLRHDLLAAAPRLAGSRSLGKNLEGLSQRTRGCRRSRLVLGGHRQLLGSRPFWGEKTGPNPTDRGKNGSKRHLITDADGVPLAIEHTGANLNDSQRAIALVDAVPPIKQPDGGRRRRPDEVLADRAYDAEDAIRRPLKRRRIIPTIGRRNDEHGSGLGAFRYVVEACFEWLFQWRRLRVRYEKRADIHQAFLNLACALICWRRLEVFC
jgi:transposase